MVTALGGAAGTAESGPSSRAQSPFVVRVNLRATRQLIQGFGSSAYTWGDPHLSNSPQTIVPQSAQQMILTLVFRKLGLTRVRPVLGPVTEPVKGTFQFAGRGGDWQIALVKQEKQYGLRLFFPDPVYLEPWMTEKDPEDAVQWAVVMLKHWRDAGVLPPYYSVLNEPQVAKNFSPSWLVQVVRSLGAQLRASGIKTKLVIPDDENPIDAYRRAAAVLADPQARQYVGAIAYHIYRIGGLDDLVRMRDLARQYRLPLWMTEFNSPNYVSWHGSFDWAVRMHTLLTLGGVNAIDYLWAFFGSWTRPATMISLNFDNGVYRSYTLTPVYWITGQYSRFVKPGYHRVEATPETGSVLASAYRGRRRVVIVALNPGGSTQTAQFSVTGGRFRGPVAAVRSSESETWHTLPSIPLKGRQFTAVLPPQSITTFVARG
jgi:O-glycosyl hydrolase